MYKKIKIRLALFILIPIFFIGIVPNCLAVEKQKQEKWVTDFTSMLDQKATNPDEKKLVLKDAITKALDGDAPACEVMRIAIGMEYKPYFVIRYIYEYSQEVKLDELCWCATSDGVENQIISKAAADAKKPNNDPVFRQNEIAKTDCLKEGLAYTAALNSPDPITPPGPTPTNPRSPITP
ncbi:MAG: hypothetical protein KAR45_04505 [Desulfobacteraceae bacterium]|nr:hypothetical protein [Desulfobacteraceae bacterium]